MENIIISDYKIEDLLKKIINKEFPKNSIFNFINSNSVYLFKNHKIFREHILRKNNFNFIDGFMISVFLSLKKFRKIKRLKGPDFSQNLLKNKKLMENKRHLFVGFFSKEDLKKILIKYPLLKKELCFCYNVPQLKKEKFDDSKLINLINKIRPDYVWIAIGNPKQEILSNDLAEKVNVPFLFNVGAFFDYAKNIKKQAPKFFQVIGLEWLYRLITDFKYTWKKVKRSFIANKHISKSVELK